jgi:hypothetical protein
MSATPAHLPISAPYGVVSSTRLRPHKPIN